MTKLNQNPWKWDPGIIILYMFFYVQLTHTQRFGDYWVAEPNMLRKAYPIKR